AVRRRASLGPLRAAKAPPRRRAPRPGDRATLAVEARTVRTLRSPRSGARERAAQASCAPPCQAARAPSTFDGREDERHSVVAHQEVASGGRDVIDALARTSGGPLDVRASVAPPAFVSVRIDHGHAVLLEVGIHSEL